MSAFICSDKHFETVLSSLEHNWSLYRDQVSIFNRLFWPKNIDHVYDSIHEMVTIWQRLNIETVKFKYADDKEQVKDDVSIHLDIVGNFEAGQRVDRTKLCKLLGCIHYQIELEHLPRELTKEERDAMGRLKDLKNELPRDILFDSNEYKESKWVID